MLQSECSMKHVIGIDVGSQSVKGCLLDPAGRVIAVGRAACTMNHPASGWAEQEPAQWRDGVAAVVRQVVEQAGLSPGDVGTIGMASQVDGGVPVDAYCRPLRDAGIWLDRRAAPP